MNTVAAEDKPNLERAEAASEGEMPVPVVNHRALNEINGIIYIENKPENPTCVALLCSQEFRRNVQSVS